MYFANCLRQLDVATPRLEHQRCKGQFIRTDYTLLYLLFLLIQYIYAIRKTFVNTLCNQCSLVTGCVTIARSNLLPTWSLSIFDSCYITAMYTARRNGPSTSAPGGGSRTLTITNNPTREENDDEQGDNPEGEIIGTLSLRVTPCRRGPRVAWDEDVIDNEGFGRKKSKSKSQTFPHPNVFILVLYFSLLYLPQTTEIRRVIGRIVF